jgi:GTP-binding protein Era
VEHSNEAITHRCGIIAVAGRPNVGKSTLVNCVLGTELSIITHKAQTTRHRITAIHTLPDAQIVFQDTPGIHEATTALNRSLVATAAKTIQEADLILMMVTPAETIHQDDVRIIEMIAATKLPAVLAINKIDMIEMPMLLPLMDSYSHVHPFEAIVPISALRNQGVDKLVRVLIDLLPEGPALFPEDDVSDLPVRFFVSEIIREQILNFTGEEIPYKTTVTIEAFEEKEHIIRIVADIHAERDSQKKILVGKRGAMIKKIGTAARLKIEQFLENRVHLELFVKVTPHWTRNERLLKEFGYQ